MFKSLYVSLVLVTLLFTGTNCFKNKGCSPKTPASEAAQMQAFATANGINVTTDPSGLMYEIVSPGTGTTVPAADATVYITYTGMRLNGTIFDQQVAAPIALPLNQLIEGWKIAIPMLKKGGHIKLIIPSSLAYGCQGKGIIDPDTIVYFDLTLADFDN